MVCIFFRSTLKEAKHFIHFRDHALPANINTYDDMLLHYLHPPHFYPPTTSSSIYQNKLIQCFKHLITSTPTSPKGTYLGQ